VLTGLPNHTLFMDRLTQVLRSALSSNQSAAVLLLDLDGFKQINDTLGRHVGDALLCRFGERLNAALPGAACVGRVSADSFAVAVGELAHGEDAAVRLVDRLQSGMRDQFNIDGHRISVTFRAGIALAPTDGEDANTLFKHAEAALKRAQSSNEAYLFFSPEFNATVVERVSLEARMRRALERHEFVLYYQPKIETESRQIVGLEALLRWEDPDHGLIMPAQIIPMLEQTGLIVPVGRAMIELALEDVRRLRSLNLAPKHIAVNVSAGQLQQPEFAENVEQLIARSGIPAQALELEITESMLMKDVEGSARTLRRLSEGGVQIAIDDFGTGYSSLRYLAKLPIGTVKIDRSFIASMVQDPDNMTIVASIVSLAHSLKLQVCAEGVETEEQAQILSLLGCEFVQGFLYGEPMPMLELVPFLEHAAGTPRPAQVAGG
jgi:diguanylate cyclase (GGDEF)-like protein